MGSTITYNEGKIFEGCLSAREVKKSPIYVANLNTPDGNKVDMNFLLEKGKQINENNLEEEESNAHIKDSYLLKIVTLENTIEKIKTVNKKQPHIIKKLSRDNLYRLSYLYAKTGQRDKAIEVHKEAVVLSK